VRLDAVPPALLVALGERWPVFPTPEPDGAGLWTLRLTLRDEADLPDVADLVLRHGVRLHALVPRRTNLEDLFVQSVQNHDV